ncbi:basic salivary proline-rich protein 1-like [Rissa tridactyla]|uniref:basic salivary proline-rich protein 1-like n=1 Tax=Rissa tridactyla TaxID=75485 RepID=UPI0023BAB010|nr:basic salivary proline-rich protein 1-like [Rissa tridactyla]
MTSGSNRPPGRPPPFPPAAAGADSAEGNFVRRRGRRARGSSSLPSPFHGTQSPGGRRRGFGRDLDAPTPSGGSRARRPPRPGQARRGSPQYLPPPPTPQSAARRGKNRTGHTDSRAFPPAAFQPPPGSYPRRRPPSLRHPRGGAAPRAARPARRRAAPPHVCPGRGSPAGAGERPAALRGPSNAGRRDRPPPQGEITTTPTPSSSPRSARAHAKLTGESQAAPRRRLPAELPQHRRCRCCCWRRRRHRHGGACRCDPPHLPAAAPAPPHAGPPAPHATPPPRRSPAPPRPARGTRRLSRLLAHFSGWGGLSSPRLGLGLGLGPGPAAGPGKAGKGGGVRAGREPVVGGEREQTASSSPLAVPAGSSVSLPSRRRRLGHPGEEGRGSFRESSHFPESGSVG